MATEAVQGATGGGADPITAVANAFSALQGTVQKGLDVFFESKEERLTYAQWLRETFPEYENLFEYKPRASTTWIYVLILGVIAIIVLIAVIRNKQAKS